MEELLNSIKGKSFDDINDLSNELEELEKTVEGMIVEEANNDQ